MGPLELDFKWLKTIRQGLVTTGSLQSNGAHKISVMCQCLLVNKQSPHISVPKRSKGMDGGVTLHEASFVCDPKAPSSILSVLRGPCADRENPDLPHKVNSILGLFSRVFEVPFFLCLLCFIFVLA